MQDFVQGFTLQCGHPPKAILLYNQDPDPRIRILAGFGSVEPDPKKQIIGFFSLYRQGVKIWDKRVSTKMFLAEIH